MPLRYYEAFGWLNSLAPTRMNSPSRIQKGSGRNLPEPIEFECESLVLVPEKARFRRRRDRTRRQVQARRLDHGTLEPKSRRRIGQNYLVQRYGASSANRYTRAARHGFSAIYGGGWTLAAPAASGDNSTAITATSTG
jgi:hypothetical protein